MPFNRYEHCFAIRCLVPNNETGDDARTQFMERFEAYMRTNYPGDDFTFVELTQERDDTGIYFSLVIQTDSALDEEDDAAICAWPEVLNAHLNINKEGIEIFP